MGSASVDHDVRAEVERLCALSISLWESLPPAGEVQLDRTVLRELLVATAAHIDALAERLHASAPLAERYPALDKWRRRILESPRRTALERAAAWECTALECEQLGAGEEARCALERAGSALGVIQIQHVA